MYSCTYIHTQGQKTHQRVAHIAVHAFIDSTKSHTLHTSPMYLQYMHKFCRILQQFHKCPLWEDFDNFIVAMPYSLPADFANDFLFNTPWHL